MLFRSKTYLANGKVVWNNGTILNAEKEQEAKEVVQEAETSDLPF